MSHSYTPSSTLLTTILLPDDLDPAVAASVNSPFKKLADAIVNLQAGTAKPVYAEFTSNSIGWSYPSNAIGPILAEGCGAGGGGGGGQNGTVGTDSWTCGAGAGAGAQRGFAIFSVSAGSTLDILVGAGGAGGTGASGGNFGFPGQDSEIQLSGTPLATFPGASGGGYVNAGSAGTTQGGIAPGGSPTTGGVSTGGISTVFKDIPIQFGNAPGTGGDGTSKNNATNTSTGRHGFYSSSGKIGAAGGSTGTDSGSYRGGGAGGGGGGGGYGAGGAGGNGGNANGSGAGAGGGNGSSASANTGGGGGGGGSGGAGTSGPIVGGTGGTGGSGRIRICYFLKVT